MPGRLAGRRTSILIDRRSADPRQVARSTTWSRTPDEAGLIGFYVPILNAPGFIAISRAHRSDYGLDADADGFWHLLPARRDLTSSSGESRPPDHTTLGSARGSAPGDILRSRRTPNSERLGRLRPTRRRIAPFLQNPTTCGVPLTARSTSSPTTAKPTHADASWPATTGCDQLSFNPSLTAQPTTDRGRHGLRPRRRPERAADAEPDDARRPRRSGRRRSPCRKASRSTRTRPTARPPAATPQARLRHASTAPMPRVLEGRHARDRQLGAARPDPRVRSTSANRSRANRYRLFLTADGFGTHVKLAGLGPRRSRRPASCRSPSKTCRRRPFSEFKLHFFGSERGPAGDADPVRHLPGESRIRAVGRGPAESDLDAVLHDRLAARRQPPARARRGPSSPASSPATRTTPPAPTRPSRSSVNRPDGDQNLAAST